MAETWSIELDRLEVIDADEDGLLSDGDEPYIIALGFRSRALTPRSTHVTWSGVLDDDWAEGSDAGDATDIPASMGRVDFDNVELATAASIAAGRLPEVLGMLAIVMESDATPFDAVRAKTNELRDVMEVKLRGLVEQGNINPANPAASIRDAIASARAQLQPSILEALGLWLSSFGDPDDIVGAQTWFFAAADARVSAGAGLPALAEQAIAVELGSNGVRYALKGRVAQHSWRGFELAASGASTKALMDAVSRVPNSMELFYIGANGAVQDRFFYDGSPWNGFELAPPGSASTTGAITALS